jgi:hypothetical protein
LLTVPVSIGPRLLTIAAQTRRAPVSIGGLGTIEENPPTILRGTGFQARKAIRYR